MGSFGRLSPGYDVRVVDADSQDCPPGTVGELLRPIGASATVDYWRHPEATKHVPGGCTAVIWCTATPRAICSSTIVRGGHTPQRRVHQP